MWKIVSEVFIDSLIDTLKIFPFIFVIYVVIELLEHKNTFSGDHERLQGKFAPLIGAATGIIPQCGFSVMAAKLYDRGLIRTGTLLAVFLATSDEALIILLSEGSKASMIVPLVAIKLVVAVIAGYGANLLLPGERLAPPLSGGDIHGFSCGREHEGGELKVFLLEPLLHSLKIFAYLLIVNILLGIVFEYNKDAVTSLIIGGQYAPYVQPLVTAAIGLIPNCASSVVITDTYINGFMTFGSCVAGLCANAGLGFVVLLKNTAKLKRNIALIVAVYAISVVAGIIINSIQLLAFGGQI